MASVSDFIELAPNEIIVKEYRSFKMKKPQNAIVNIAATNMRLILYGQSSRGRKSGRPTLTQEIRIEDIRGVEIYEKEKPNLLLIILGLFFLASAALLYINRLPSVYRILENILGNGSHGIIITMILGLALLGSAFIFRNREFDILVKGNSSNLNTGMFSEKTVFKEGIDSPRILRELGSIVIKIQKDRERLKNELNAKAAPRAPPYYEMSRKEFGVEDLIEDKKKESLFDDDHIPRSRPEKTYQPRPAAERMTASVPEAKPEEAPVISAENNETIEHAQAVDTPETVPAGDARVVPGPAEEVPAEETEIHAETNHTEETEEIKAEEKIPETVSAEKKTGKNLIEDYYERRREKINVDDILETMQMIENPTSKKKDDFLF